MSKEITLRIKLGTLIMIAIGVGAFFGGYYFATYREVGYPNGYAQGVKDLFLYNTQPEKWIQSDAKAGLAFFNNTSVQFFFNDGNTTRVIDLKSFKNLGTGQEHGTLYIKVDPIDIPKDVGDSLGLTKKRYFIFETAQGQQILLGPR
jgi:hypothetical protein